MSIGNNFTHFLLMYEWLVYWYLRCDMYISVVVVVVVVVVAMHLCDCPSTYIGITNVCCTLILTFTMVTEWRKPSTPPTV